MASSSAPLLSGTIEADDEVAAPSYPTGNIGQSAAPKPAAAREPVVLVPGTTASSAEQGGIAGILKASSHPVALFFLFFFRSAAIAVYVLCGFFTTDYVLSIVLVVILLSLDFWNTRNIAGRTLVGLRYWNEVDDDGESSWVFESRDASHVANAIDSKMFWIALYSFPLGWVALLIFSILKFNVSFVPIVLLALVFNFSNVVGFTYADRDAQKRFQNASSNLFALGGLGGIGGQVLGGVVRNSVGRVFR
ncbi:Golgi apparatus membrane protein tvp23 [Vanrija albida]|uniref:Golgi apparatus membrane protein TVP23 n=1 Tax=Vanrija albida TaxID=181172 RepID=A0ABR3Q2A5_9TREE